MKTSTFWAACLAAVVSLASLDAQAQQPFVVHAPDGSLGISNGNGTYTYFSPRRLMPGANVAIPGSVTQLPNGVVYVGQDGNVHGNVLAPNGDIHLYNRPPTSPAFSSDANPSARTSPSATPRLRPRYPMRPSQRYAPMSR